MTLSYSIHERNIFKIAEETHISEVKCVVIFTMCLSSFSSRTLEL